MRSEMLDTRMMLQKVVKELPSALPEAKIAMEAHKYQLASKLYELYRLDKSAEMLDVCTTPGCGRLEQVNIKDVQRRFPQGFKCMVCVLKETDPSIFETCQK